MKTKAFWITFALVCAVLISLMPVGMRQLAWGDPLFDGLLSDSLGSLPVQKAGRIMPISSAAADSLKSAGGKSTAKTPEGRISAAKWLWLLNAKPHETSSIPLLRTDNKKLQELLGADGRNFSYDSAMKNYDALYRGASSGESVYAQACADVLNAAFSYAVSSRALAMRLGEHSKAEDSRKAWRDALAAGVAEMSAAKREGREQDKAKLAAAAKYLSEIREAFEIENQSANSAIRTIPASGAFLTPSQVLSDRNVDAQSDAIASTYAKIIDSLASDNRAAAKEYLGKLKTEIAATKTVNFFKVRVEDTVNAFDPFLVGFILYFFACAFFVSSACFKWQREGVSTAGLIFLLFATSLHILSIIARMYIQERPPVTNLYSSIVFTGAVAAAISCYLYIRKSVFIYALAGSICGLLSLLVAMNLPYSGDTMGMMRAVLNSNFWLTLHVVTIMVGYCGVFLAGFVAQIRLFGNVFNRENTGRKNSETAHTVYAVLCFALLFSFAGTMLGGIWADMSWGRFWGWDPKENGALMIVLWCAAAIHAKMSKVIGDKTFLAMAIFGNIVAAWAWFGVNLMGVGLHAYGFIDGGWMWFIIFVATQLATIPLSYIKQT